MNTLLKRYSRCMAAALLAVSVSVLAQTSTDHSHHSPASAPAKALAVDTEFADGEVRRLDLEAGKVTLRHGDIKSLDMPPMTMVFHVDKALLAQLKVGDKIRFKAVHEAGKYTVTDIQAKP